ncbi:MAG TPA: Wzz/FepE/Etk N-terminal domain-containing protein [Verrucomicrobiae bacterium]|nr:Wzz/FepE/Etk N-terminal domain-containing protein [Verrucomicrobiae bacterium]
MENRPQIPPASGMALDDIYYVIFRHKWKIMLLLAAGIVAAGTIYRTKPPDYQSEAKLMIKYVVDNASPGPAESDAHMQSTDPQGQTIINTEIEILTSLDVAKKAAEDIGPEKILARVGGGHDLMQAAGFINGHLKVVPLTRSSVLAVDLKHPDPEMVQPILNQIISEYKNRHREIHQPHGNFSDFYTQTTDKFKNDLADIEKQLKQARTNVGVTSTEEAMKEYSKAIEKTAQDIRDAEAEMAFRTASFNALTSLSFPNSKVTNANTNLLPKSGPAIPSRVTEEYARVSKRLANLWARDEELGHEYLPGSTIVEENSFEIKKAEAQKQKLEEEYPGIKLSESQMLASKPQSGPAQPADPALNLSNQVVLMSALKSKIDYLKSRLTELQAKAAKIADVQPQISELEQGELLVRENLQNYTKSLWAARINDALGADKVPNIIVIQEPSPPGRDWAKRYKAMMMLVVAGLGGGLVWAFLIEFYLDTSVKRPKEVRAKLGLPLFLSIPEINGNGWRHRALGNGQLRLKNGNGHTPAAIGNGTPEPAATL